MKEFIYRGLKLSTNCNYFKAVKGISDSCVEDPITSTLTLTYTDGSTSETLSNLLGLTKIGKSIELGDTDVAQRIRDYTVTLNGLKLKKLTLDNHVINIIIVSDCESRVSQDYWHTTIVVSKEDAANPEFVKFLFYSGNLKFLQPVGPMPSCWEIRNFPKIILKNTDTVLTSDSREIFQLRRSYDDYVIRAIDYQEQAITEIRRILDGYGLELVRQNKEETLKKTSYVVYQFSQTPTRKNHPYYGDEASRVLSQKLPINFTLHTTDMVLFFDFKNKYSNIDLLTNFCEFKTYDRYGKRWTAAIKWGGITEDFNHQYQPDDNSNFSYQCQFMCELHFYEVFDDRFEILKEIKQSIDVIDSEG
jgi:hypothetical protein